MSATVIAFFNNKGGVGKTSLVYHLAWMYAELGMRVVAADLDPQADLTGAFLDEDRLEEIWPDGDHPDTIFGCLQPLLKRTGDIEEPHRECMEEKIALLVGDLALSGFEDELSQQWPGCLDGKERALRVLSAFWRILRKAADAHGADLVLIDLGPNLGSINRAALIAADHVVVPLSPDLFSLQGLQNLGPTLRRWRKEWRERVASCSGEGLNLPEGSMSPLGYVVMQHSVRLDRPTRLYGPWIARIPGTYRNTILGDPSWISLSLSDDPHCLAVLKSYRSLMPMAQEARMPMFHLKPAHGAIGAHLQAVQDAYKDFAHLAREIARRTAVKMPQAGPTGQRGSS